jgi:hypothetical protein
MIFYFGNQLSQASAKLLTYSILHMHGVGNHLGWFWLFTLMGAFTVFYGFIYGLFLLNSFHNLYSTFLPGVHWLTERELHILQTHILLDDLIKNKKKRKILLLAFKRAV